MLDLVLPPACRLCDEPVASQADFCLPCLLGLTLSESVMRSACHRCGLPGRMDTSATQSADSHSVSLSPGPTRVEKCVYCKNEKFRFDCVVANWIYQGLVCEAIVAAKSPRQAALGHALGKQLGRRVVQTMSLDLPDTITFVPSNLRRQWSRGGRNGNIVIAEAVQRCIADAGKRIAVKPLLRTTRYIEKQAWLSDAQRRKNVCGAFATKKGYAWLLDLPILRALKLRAMNLGAMNLGALKTPVNPIKDQHILVVDDVLTTGSTANEVASVLHHAGARRVTLAVVARAVRSRTVRA